MNAVSLMLGGRSPSAAPLPLAPPAKDYRGVFSQPRPSSYPVRSGSSQKVLSRSSLGAKSIRRLGQKPERTMAEDLG
jgi:hypothetical protein